jgi:hypothetical protein
MADVNTVVNDFLRDAQYRVAELAIAINEGKKKHKRRRGKNTEEKDWRTQLLLWMDILFDSRNPIYSTDYNFLFDWTDREIIAECEYLRALTGMNNIPFLTWAGYSPTVRVVVTQQVAGNLPAGNEDDIITYDGNGNPITIPFPKIGGMQSETISQYFS